MSELDEAVKEKAGEAEEAPAEAEKTADEYELSELADGEMDLGSVEVMWRLTDEIDVAAVHEEAEAGTAAEEAAQPAETPEEAPEEAEEAPADTEASEEVDYIEETGEEQPEEALPETLEIEETEKTTEAEEASAEEVGEAPEDDAETEEAQEAPEQEKTPEAAEYTEEVPVYHCRKPRRRYVYVGTFTAAISLVIMGIALTLSLNSPYGMQGAFKVSPVILALLGGEILMAVIVNRTARLKFSLKSLITMTLLIGLSFTMSLISATFTATGEERHYAEERLHNIISREIHEKIPTHNISSAGIDMKLYGADTGAYRTSADLGSGDVINVSFRFSEVQESVFLFSQDCRAVMDALSELGYPFGEVSFTADDGGDRYSLKVDWLYQSDLNTMELLHLVGYYGEDISFDIPDISDDE